MLSQKYSEDVLKDILISRDDWRPFPTALTRYAWEALPDAVRQAQIARGVERLNFDWPGVPAVRFLDYARNGNRSWVMRAMAIARGTRL